MQINSYPTTQTLPIQQSTLPTETSATDKQVAEPSVQVAISAQAQQLAKTDNVASQPIYVQPVPLPNEPQQPLSGEKLEQAVQFKKAQLQYQATADMANLLANSRSNISAAGAYHLSQNEDTRELVLETKSQQQTIANMQSYQQKSNAMNEQYA